MPAYLLDRYFNLLVTVSINNESLVIEKLEIGKLQLPVWLANAILKYAHQDYKERTAKFLGSRVVPVPLKRHQITLSGRQDLAKHFITSAAITVSAGTGVAYSFGIMKEIEDSSA